jgi:hypothetical protein
MANEVVLDRDGVDDEIAALGARVTRNGLVRVLPGEPAVFVAECTLADDDSGEILGTWEGEAYVGDCQGTDIDLPDMPTNRAKIRARREALYQLRRLRRGWKETPQPAHVREMMAAVRETAKRLEITDGELHLLFHERHGLNSLNDATLWQARAISRECAEMLVDSGKEPNGARN